MVVRFKVKRGRYRNSLLEPMVFRLVSVRPSNLAMQDGFKCRIPIPLKVNIWCI